MTLDIYFRASSYGMIAAGALALAVSGGMGIFLAVAFGLLLVVAWKLEGTRWQLSEQVGLIVVLLALPLFFLDWKYQSSIGEVPERVGVGALAHLILFLSAVKLLQIKADRDWVFLYLISFFEVLLAAGLSISPLYLAMLSLYVMFALCTILSFEIRKAQRAVNSAETRLLVAPDSTLIRRLTKQRMRQKHGEARRLPLVAFVLLLLIFALALPLFLIAPRYGSNALARTSGSTPTGMIGFSETVALGDIGRLQQNSRVVMRVRVDDPQAERNRNLRWRGVALDEFTGRVWHKSTKAAAYAHANNERGFFQLGTTEGLHRLTTQTFFLEPIDSPVLFAAPRVVAVQGASSSLPYVRRDRESSLSTREHEQERITYKAYSDTTEPEEELLRADSEPYPQAFARYLQLPSKLDPRIAQLARDVIAQRKVRNRYDAARALEVYLQQFYGYTLEMKAGGDDPLADFLFRVREGHCEYFSTAMAIMLRTQGIAARVVNGFQMGEYNDAADAYTVTQRDAHSWVEVYFPGTDAWVTFDPTPATGRPVRTTTGLSARLNKYAEALELLWVQYVVSYDRQEQRHLATAMRNSLSSYRQAIGEEIDTLKVTAAAWWRSLQGTGGLERVASSNARLAATILLSILVLSSLVLLLQRVRRLGLWRGWWFRQAEAEQRSSAIEFYKRMTDALAARGLRRAVNETPLEFATGVGIPEVLTITRAYNSVRYGEKNLSAKEVAEIEQWLARMEGAAET